MKDFVKPVIVLIAICLLMTAALAFVNQVTEPVIAEAEEKAQNDALNELVPDCEYIAVSISDTDYETDYPSVDITNIFKAVRGEETVAYIIKAVSDGYHSGGLTLMIAINPLGNVIATKTLANEESAGVGSKVSNSDFEKQFAGLTPQEVYNIDTISGATRSSNAYKNAVLASMQLTIEVLTAGGAA